MKRLKRLFLMAFCLPLALICGVAAGEPDGKDPDPDPHNPGQEGPPAAPAEELPKTQEELDALIEKRLARERKKLAKQGATPPAQPPAQPTSTPGTPPVPAAQPTAPDPALVQANRELLLARAQLDAIRDGVNPSAVEDAVYLALREAEKEDEADQEGIREALKEVLKRHPEWKQSKKEGSGGFKFGADGGQTPTGEKKALPTGKVIF